MNKTLLAAALLCASLAQAAATPTLATPAVPEPTVKRWADRCSDFTRNGWAFKAPRNFLQWLEVFSDPGIWLEFGRRGLDPQSYVGTLSSLLDPGTAKNYLEWSDPAIYDKWAKAAAEPDYITAVDAILFDPGRAMRWAMLPIDARAWSLLGLAVNPETWGKWLTAPFHPATQDLVKKALDPETALNWARVLADPANYPALRPAPQMASGGNNVKPSGNPYPRDSGAPWRKAI